MVRSIIASVLLGSWALPALAQPLPFGTTPPPKIAKALPAPALGEDASSVELLRAAENALAAGRVDEAREAMEMAQTRLLDRSEPIGVPWTPSDKPAVKLISQGLQALTAGDRMTCLRMIQAAMQSAGTQQ